MKNWLKQFRIAGALESRRPLPTALQQSIARDETLRQFAEETVAIGDTLRRSKPVLKTPAGLHSSIMNAVRSEAEEPRQAQIIPWLRWLAAPAATALVLAGVWLLIRPERGPESAPPTSLAAATTALELPHTIARDVPAQVLAPLSDEMDRVNRDLDRTREFLIASLP
jgi:negative regulator of sigma E activity